jgi:hypothetical protein
LPFGASSASCSETLSHLRLSAFIPANTSFSFASSSSSSSSAAAAASASSASAYPSLIPCILPKGLTSLHPCLSSAVRRMS